MKFHNYFLAPIILLLSAALFNSPAAAQISWIKAFTPNSSKSTGTSIAVTVPSGGIAAGNSIIVSFAMDPASGTVSCTDTAANSYVSDRDVINGSSGSGVRTVILSAHNVTALVSGNTITCTHPSVAARALGATEFSGLVVSGTKDQTTSTTGQSTAPSSGNTSTTTQATELLIGAVGVEGPNGDTFTPGANYSTTGRGGTTGGNAATNITINPEYRIVAATGAYAATGTLDNSRQWGAAIVTYKGAAPSAATKLVITSVNSGSNPVAGVGFPVVVQSQNASGTPTNATAATNVSLSLKTGTGILGGTLTGTIAAGSNQVTITGVTYTKAESGVVITATRTSGDNLTAGDSATFTVVPGAPNKVAFSTQPGNSSAGSAISGPPTVVVQDSFNNTITSSTASIAIAIGTNPGGGTLSGTTPKNASNGIASFNDLSINQGGIGYTLVVTSAGLTSATSSSFNINATTGTVGGTVVRSSDSSPISGALVEALQGGVLKGSATTAANGSYSISNLAVGSYDIRASAASYGTQTQNGQSVTAGTTTTVNFSLVSAPNITGVSPSSGVIGTVVTVNGTGFGATQGTSTVTLNGTSATPSSWTDTTIVAPVPSSASTGLVVVTVAGVASNGATFTVQGSGSVIYVYDELGRLRAVTEPSSDTAVYNYDAVGNLLSITRQSSALVSIIEFSPTSGPAGTNVTIYGTGFSATAGQNTVAFNGLTAVIVSATATKIVVTVPAGATTGLINVTSPSGSAISSKNFTVGNLLAPTITGFTPAIGTAGTPVTITGTNFQTTTSANSIRFNLTLGNASAATSTSISTTVPTFTGSGRISVSTSYGRATSNADFFIPPSPYTPTDVAHTGRMIAGGSSHTLTISSSGKIGLVVFEGIANKRISLQMSNVTFGWASVSIVKPDQTNLVVGASGPEGSFIDSFTLPTTGTYTIFVDPQGSFTGNMTLTLNDIAQDFTGTITPGGSPVTVSTTVPGQNGRVTFNGTANQKVSLQMTNVTYGWASVSIVKADQTNLVTTGTGPGGNFIDTVTLPTTGTYTIFVDPQGSFTGNMTLTLNDIAQDFTGTITPGGSPVTVSTTVPGQNGRVTFNGTANQKVSLQMTNVTYGWASVSIVKADQTNLVTTGTGPGGNFIDTVTLPTTGTYTIFVDPQGTFTGNMTLTLNDIAQDFTGTITPGGSPVTVSTTVPGQNGRVTFNGTANQKVSLQMTNVTYGWASVSIVKPDQTNLVTTGTGPGGNFIDTVTLPTTGTYTIFVDPQGSFTGNMTLMLYDVIDITGTVSVGGPSLPVSITSPGQRAILTFAGTASQQVTVRITDNTIPWMTVQLNKPDGTQLTASSSGSASFNLSTQTLPSTGTYSIVVDPQLTNLGNLSVNVTSP